MRWSAGEALALGLTPCFSQLMAAVGFVVLVHVHPTARDVLHGPVTWTVILGEKILFVVVAVLVSSRYVLALFVYPAWLRPQRRADQQRLGGLR